MTKEQLSIAFIILVLSVLPGFVVLVKLCNGSDNYYSKVFILQ